jgi:hypothetical protein
MAQITLATRAHAQLNMLTVMFLLGMAVNLVGLPSEATGSAKAITSVLLGLHILIAIGMIVGAILTIRVATQQGSDYRKLAHWGGVATGFAFIAGAITVATDNSWWSYAMAFGFIASAWIYGLLYVRAKQAK